MTPQKPRPYTSKAIRPLIAILAVALSACATEVASRAELSELTASVRALRADNARLERRIDRIEQQTMIARVKAETKDQTPPKPKQAAPKPEVLPSLTVVKLKPKREPAPPLMTNVDVQEPTQEITERVAPAAAKDDADDEADAAIAQAQYDNGLEALKTGDVDGGIAQLKKFAVDWPHHPRADNALYFAAVGLFTSGQVEQAAALLQQTIARYPAGDAVVDSMLKLADCHVKLNQPQAARATWEKVVTTYPGTAAATQAQARLASHSSPH